MQEEKGGGSRLRLGPEGQKDNNLGEVDPPSKSQGRNTFDTHNIIMCYWF